MKNPKLLITLSSEERAKLEALGPVFGKKSLSGTIQKMIRFMYHLKGVETTPGKNLQ